MLIKIFPKGLLHKVKYGDASKNEEIEKEFLSSSSKDGPSHEATKSTDHVAAASRRSAAKLFDTLKT